MGEFEGKLEAWEMNRRYQRRMSHHVDQAALYIEVGRLKASSLIFSSKASLQPPQIG